MKKIILPLLLTIFYVSVFAQKKTLNADFSEMLGHLLSHSVDEVLPKEMTDQENIVFLDAREKEEYLVSHLKNARWVGYDTFKKKRVKDIPKDQAIVVYCTVGYRSEKIAEKLQKMGYSNVSNLYGGIFEWIHQNKEVFNKNSKTDKIHTYNKDWSKWLKKGEKIY